MLFKRFWQKRERLTAPNYFHSAPKTGSTTLYYILERHRDFCAARGKEPNFFSNDEYFEKGEDFFWSDCFAHCKKERAAGDFSTQYFMPGPYRKSLSRIFDQRSPGNTYFSTCIRHPLMWHWSHYLHRVRNVDGFRKFAPMKGTFQTYLEEKQKHGNLTAFTDQLSALQQIYAKTEERDNLLVLVYERDVAPDISIAYEKICNLLSIDPSDFLPIKGIKSNERTESVEIIRSWEGPGTFKNVRTNRAYFPAVYQTKTDGVSESGDAFSKGDIIIERDATHLSVIRNPDIEAKRRFLDYYDSVSTSMTLDDVADLTERYFKEAMTRLQQQLGEDVPEWRADEIQLPQTEWVVPSYV